MIHTFSQNGYHIALDVYSGSIHITDAVSLQAIRLHETLTREETIECLRKLYPDDPELAGEAAEDLLDELDALREAGKLYTGDVFEAHAGRLKQNGAAVKALCLHVAHACNLACSYCFAGQGSYYGSAGLMSLQTGKKALDFLISHSAGRRHLEVDFFGGEPLLNWQVVKALVVYGRELEKKHNKVFRFTLTTNGVLLDEEAIAFCNQEMQNVVLSLDGRKEVHDRFRVDRKGNGSYDHVVPRFQRFVQQRGDKGYYIRGTFTQQNTDFLNDILHMADLGFTQLSMEPVVMKQGDPCALREEDLPILCRQYELLAAEMLRREREGRGFSFYHYNIDLEHGPCVYKRLSGCGSGTEYMAVTPEGELYPCHQFVGEEQYRLGDLDHGVINQKLRDEFSRNNLYAHPECRSCWAKLYCAGGCAANACHATGSMSGIYSLGCELFKKRIECAIMLQAALTDDMNHVIQEG
jgi:uncharacterized protein